MTVLTQLPADEPDVKLDAVGVRLLRPPITPERIREALRKG